VSDRRPPTVEAASRERYVSRMGTEVERRLNVSVGGARSGGCAVLSYLFAAVLSLFVLMLMTQLWKADLRVPLHYFRRGDAMVTCEIVKNLVESGWYLNNDRVGYPEAAHFQDFPISETVHLLLMKLIALGTSDYALVLNLFFILTFPLTAVVCLFVLRKLGVSSMSALAASLLYTFLPAHLMRGQVHLFFATYYFVPLLSLPAILIATEMELFAAGAWKIRRAEAVTALVACVLAASAGIYYAFFGAFFLLIAGVIAAIRRRSLKVLISPAVLIASLVVTILLNVAPSLLFWLRHGMNSAAILRSPDDADRYGLRLADLLLPVAGHRIPLFARAKQIYDTLTASTNESSVATLGVVAAFGFVILIAWLFVGEYKMVEGRQLRVLSLFNISAVLLAIIGGFSTFPSFLGFSAIRAYSRINVYIGFFSLTAAALTADSIRRRWAVTPARRVTFGLLLVAVLTGGLIDVASGYFIPLYAVSRHEFEQEARFVRQIERTVPPDSAIFQLPYMAFPESGSIVKMRDYDLFSGYMHSSRLRWSYGAIKGRSADASDKRLAALTPPDLVDGARAAGFAGLYIDTFGYGDGAALLRSELERVLNRTPISGDDGRLLFFDLKPQGGPLSDAQRQVLRDAWLNPIGATWAGDFSGYEGTPDDNWRWCGPRGQLVLTNPSDRVRKMRVEMSLVTGYETPSAVEIDGGGVHDELATTIRGLTYSRTLVLAPGVTTVIMKSSAPRVAAPGDPRTLVFRVNNFRTVETW
jgi:hypothetical protein